MEKSKVMGMFRKAGKFLGSFLTTIVGVALSRVLAAVILTAIFGGGVLGY